MPCTQVEVFRRLARRACYNVTAEHRHTGDICQVCILACRHMPTRTTRRR